MKKNLLTASIKSGKILFKRPEIARLYLNNLECESVNIEISKAGKNTTCEEYGYLFGIVLQEISEYTGHTKEELLLYYKLKFHYKPVEIMGELHKMPLSISRSKREANRKSLAQFINNIIRDAVNIGLIISESNSIPFLDEK